jgi:hypothetical protein
MTSPDRRVTRPGDAEQDIILRSRLDDIIDIFETMPDSHLSAYMSLP